MCGFYRCNLSVIIMIFGVHIKVLENAYHLLTFIPEFLCLLSSSILHCTVEKTSKSKFLMQIKTFFPKKVQ